MFTRQLLIICLLCIGLQMYADDGGRLWMPRNAVAEQDLTTREIITSELRLIPDIEVIIGTKDDKSYIREFINDKELQSLGEEEYIIRSRHRRLIVAGGSEIALLYATYRLVRDYNAGLFPEKYDLRETPSYRHRLLNHWDNLDGSIERGYAGRSIWWQDDTIRVSLIRQYARACASIGVNGAVLNNVNASPQMLNVENIDRVRRIAYILRPYGVKVYLSINFSTPKALGGLPTADPLDKNVIAWWDEKIKEIYRMIPDFGGFLVKANSEGLPGPQDYNRTHADGANMLADALLPYGGIVMWRAFVYKSTSADRACQAYDEFVPFDGKFRENVIIQIKNGPIDFQPREPFSPLFGAMSHTAIMPELQITQEYLGFSNHLVYLAPLFEECLDSDTYACGEGSTVARITDGSLYHREHTAIAGVANTGLDVNWCGHHFAQANWYAFGRLAWCDTLSSEKIGEEWLRLTFSHDDRFLIPVKNMMMASREAAVNYMMPMGLHHLFAFGHHYGPEPWCERQGARADWLPSYYHRADSVGVGFDRTFKGSNAVSQYNESLSSLYGKMDTCPETLLLWFHHAPWGYQMKNGESVWNNLCYSYQQGVDAVRDMIATWNSIRVYIDADRFAHVQERLQIQLHDAIWWKDACLLYFQTYSHLPFPSDIEPPVYTLEELKQIRLNMNHHN